MTRKTAAIFGSAVVLAFLLFPFELEVAPRWRVHARDAAGQWQAGCEVTQSWQWTGVESMLHHDVAVTNASGIADFSRKTIRASLLRRVLGMYGAKLAFHGYSYGPTVFFLACGHGRGPGQLSAGTFGGTMDFSFIVEPLR